MTMTPHRSPYAKVYGNHPKENKPSNWDFEEVFPTSFLQFRRQCIRVLKITGYWVLCALLQDIYDQFVILNYAAENIQINFTLFLLTDALTCLIAGLIGGPLIVFFLEKIWRQQPMYLALPILTICYSVVMSFSVAVGGLVHYCLLFKLPIFAPEVLAATMDTFQGMEFLKNYATWWVISIVTILILQINDKYGPGMVADLATGRYFKPKREERIFMFLDLRSSTQIAEKLGELAYFRFIQQLFKDATDPVLRTKGEIYQYIGDEIIISWKMRKGLQKANCLHCFFAIQKVLKDRAGEYEAAFGITPTFKAGLHYGKVMAGEVGIIKKDVSFFGDVLNTTARIQSICNDYHLDLLVSDQLLEILTDKSKFEVLSIGDIQLRGKQEKIGLSTVFPRRKRHFFRPSEA